ncbi:hypothetical protein CBR_g4224 [Chara braunii]|uniref:Uncharacterized protein n=1 Tax=Chara braunii TaxID=69332 RepID=A0A388JR60_CHABU|nr:hypothetical protein CBR_g4224 [Chara braunii]|eukprot:GBG60271.1 hypothetical protein CBR_g4224 [Chara braunii]
MKRLRSSPDGWSATDEYGCAIEETGGLQWVNLVVQLRRPMVCNGTSEGDRWSATGECGCMFGFYDAARDLVKRCCVSAGRRAGRCCVFKCLGLCGVVRYGKWWNAWLRRRNMDVQGDG